MDIILKLKKQGKNTHTNNTIKETHTNHTSIMILKPTKLFELGTKYPNRIAWTIPKPLLVYSNATCVTCQHHQKLCLHQLVLYTVTRGRLRLRLDRPEHIQREVNQFLMLNDQHEACSVGCGLYHMMHQVVVVHEDTVQQVPEAYQVLLIHKRLNQILLLSRQNMKPLLARHPLNSLHRSIGPFQPLYAQVLLDDVRRKSHPNLPDNDFPFILFSIHIHQQAVEIPDKRIERVTNQRKLSSPTLVGKDLMNSLTLECIVPNFLCGNGTLHHYLVTHNLSPPVLRGHRRDLRRLRGRSFGMLRHSVLICQKKKIIRTTLNSIKRHRKISNG